jgi:hypothetical protein
VLVNNTAGSGTGTGAVVINNGGTLGGSGKVSGATTLNSGGTIAPGAGNTLANTSLHGSSLLWNGGGTIALQLGATTGDELNLSGALTKGTAGTFTIDLLNEGITTQTSYTLLTFASTTFHLSDFKLELPINFTGTLVETSTSLSITNLQDPPSELPAPSNNLASGTSLTSDTSGSTDNSISPSSELIATPEPRSAMLLGFGGIYLLGWRRRRKS